MNEVVISVGSNINPEINVENAQANLAQGDRFLQASQFYRTKPMEYLEQDDFLNGAFLVETDDDYETFRQKLKQIEIKQGRVKTANKAGPRTIDLDIIVWNGKIVDQDFYNWDFVYKTVLEVKPDLIYDQTKLNLSPQD